MAKKKRGEKTAPRKQDNSGIEPNGGEEPNPWAEPDSGNEPDPEQELFTDEDR
jgi:hypothetical protein